MKILVVGAGAVGLSVARELTASGNEVSIIDKKPSAMRISSVPDASWHLADAGEPPALAEAGAGDADIVVAATGDDKANLVVSLLAKTEFGVDRVIARVNNPRNEWLFNDSWGVDVTVSTPRIMASLVEDAVADGSLAQVLSFHQSGAAMWQVTVSEGAPVIGSTVRSLVIPAGVIVNAIVRDGVPVNADPDLVFAAADQVLFLAGPEAADITELQSLFLPASEDTAAPGATSAQGASGTGASAGVNPAAESRN
ncbi:potassium channel family protein [Actinobaculum suis]|uniref:potassium channel family protein n=1 Tax=Actinobaculum suis TaxID=1657 RepID=UPI00066FF44F|nr:TrkA family potassium uptake protein [Actinobaculum suis]KMY22858.1 portal protein [Actinobaculum suis]OCA93966.1 portal protein [Actinobaculum suis]OCA94532.1 portal protein [Actinobaculum suis]